MRALRTTPWTERIPNDEVLRRVGEKMMLIGSTVEINLRHSHWFTSLVEGGVRKGEGRTRVHMSLIHI